MTEPRYQCSDVFMVRAPLRPLPTGDERRITGPDTVADPDSGTGTAPVVTDFDPGTASAGLDPLFAEAVAVASPSLASVLERVAVQGAPPSKPKDLRRLTSALARYRTRMATRATPFGLFAGVGVGEFGPAAHGRIGTAHRTYTRPDAGWLTMLIRRLEQDPEILRTLRVRSTDTWHRRGERVVLTDRQSCDEGTIRSWSETSVRFTSAVHDVLHIAAEPIVFEQLVAELDRRYPAATRAVLERFLVGLVGQGFLVTELCPPPDAPSSLDHVLDLLERVPAAPTRALLRSIREAIQDYDRRPLGTGLEAFRTASSLMTDLQPAEHVLQVDVALDTSVTLPQSVADDLSQAVEHLWRLSPPTVGSRDLRS